jgi:L-fucose mutarotase
MLKGISRMLSPELLKIMMEMGHGDELVLGDGNFPATSHAQRLVRADGHSIPAMLDAILPLFPLDYAVDFTAVLMDSRGIEPNVWKIYKEKLNAYPDGDKQFLVISKPDFYERAKKAYCVVATSETERFANIIIRKGIIK